MKALLDPLLELHPYQRILEGIQNNRTPVFGTGAVGVEKSHIFYGLGAHTKRPILILTHSELRGRELAQELAFFHSDVMYYPAKDILFYSADVHGQEVGRRRFQVIESLLAGNPPILVASMEALCERFVEKEEFQKFILEISVGDVWNINELMKKLIFLGYERTEIVESRGQFSLRGGILDVFSLTAEEAIRIEFWDDEIDSIRAMEVATQRSTEKLDKTTIFPMNELVYAEEMAKVAADRITKEYVKTRKAMEKTERLEAAERLQEHAGEDAERLRLEGRLSNVGGYISYFYDKTVSLLDYIPKDTILCLDEPDRIHTHMETVMDEYSESMKGRIAEGYLLPKQSELLFSYAEVLHKMDGFVTVLLAGLNQRAVDFSPKEMVHFMAHTTPSFGNQLTLFCEELQFLKKEGYRVLILTNSGSKGQRMARDLEDLGVYATYVENLNQPMAVGSIWVSRGNLAKGFRYEACKLAVFSDQELFGGEKKRKPKKKKKGATIESFTDVKIGDYVVHDDHGIGIYGGLEKITLEGIQKDYMKISYRDGGNLYVSVNQMDRVQKYIGSGGGAPRMNKLGGGDWAKAKAKTRAVVQILAEDLVALYAKRAAAKGFACGVDTSWQSEFEEAFPYAETDDQLHAIEDMKADMESTKVMDRLICGDVGYGKTEVAIRGAFKTVQEGKQVAFLVPTTILAQQHYHNFVERMSGYPIQLELLSRFRTPKQQKESLANMKSGMGDILIGTHRILSKDVEFKDLGLVIVDEEQRFGVAHKEKLKRLRDNVDVLTLSATPIPRTLHMSLSGIRDMSLLEEPPQERQPVQTYVMENNAEFVREAIHREIARGGQVYYLYNRVNSIAEEAFRLQKLVPEANIAYGHGQMSERELERIMEGFISGETDVLVCTTIIETGLDIANANTIIIQDADKMGLSQLYQLRGRVGRSSRIAYAYLLYQRNKMLREVAEKRLQTIREFTEFGSGFKIAMRDLEIRGAGNLLGAEQHGHMETVGYDMYCRLLEEAVQTLKGEEPKPKTNETSVDLQMSAFIPDFYIKNQAQRMEMYQKIATIRNEDGYFDMIDEMMDRYGDLPKSVQILLEIVLLKAEANALGIASLVQKRDVVLVGFAETVHFDTEKLTKTIVASKGQYLFTAGAKPYVTIKLAKQKGVSVIDEIKLLLNQLK
ncbi:transcription-repair coupling factor [Chakrabartyella piscis]|uniref:transcription-repair coupling factor n=1 Tax=Chakrabartyella piscis TaxID=2918914 RepID=UPI002958C194|nr:transcription-repair coupling factor [Chakrabartyella piscis]